MKTIRLFLFAAAVLSMAACSKLESSETIASEENAEGVRTVTFTVATPDTKAVLGVNADSKPQTFWENGDQITVYTQADGKSGSQEGYAFTTTLADNATSATFSYTGEGCASGNYLAIYPAASAARTVNFTGDGDIYKMAAVDVPNSQTLVAGSFDKSAAIMTAYAPAGSTTLEFKNAVALLKFQVSGANIVAGKIAVADADKISGRYRADLSTTSPYEPTLTAYSTTGVVQYNFVDFSLGGSALATGTDYYVAVRPTALTSGLKVYLNGNLVKSFTSSQLSELVRNKIYNLGTLSIPTNPAEKILYFDFTSEPPTGGDPAWPTSETKANYPHVDGGETFSYLLYGTKYSFVLADCGGATNTSANVFWHTSTKALVFNAQKRYLGFPAIEGYKLKEVVCSNKSGTTTAKFEIVKSISTTTDHPADSEIVSAAQVWGTKGIDYTYTISNPAANTRYYLYCLVKGSIGAVKLTYVP